MAEYFNFIPPNLAAFGVKRRTEEPIADLKTIWQTPYPIITRYQGLCNDAGLALFGGGSMDCPAPSPIKPGAITSGYRDTGKDIESRSPHAHTMALDIFIGTSEDQVRVAQIALQYYTRVGLYPDEGFIHVDLMPLAWVQRYGKTASWVRLGGKYASFPNLNGSIAFVQAQGV